MILYNHGDLQYNAPVYGTVHMRLVVGMMRPVISTEKRLEEAEEAKKIRPSGHSSDFRVLRLFIKFLLPVFVLAGGYSSYIYLKSTKPDVRQSVAKEKTWPVHSVTVKFSDFQPKLHLYGELVSGRKVTLRSLVSGEIIEVGRNLREGAIIQKGERLVVIDPFTFQGALTEAQARLREAKARLAEIQADLVLEKGLLAHARAQSKLAKKDLDRALPLVKKGTVSSKLVDDRRLIVSERLENVGQRENTLNIKKARGDQQKAVIERLEWGVRQAERNLQNTILRAPFTAYIREINAEIGRMLTANDSVATLLDKEWLDVQFILSDHQFGRITAYDQTVIGREVEVRWHVGNKPLIYSAVIERIDAELSSETGGIGVYARLRLGPQNQIIRAGAFVEVMVADQSYNNVVRLPETSLYDGNLVYVIEGARLAPRKVTLVGTAGDHIFVRGNLQKGERVLRTRLSTAGRGLKVRDQSSKLNPDNRPLDQPSYSQQDGGKKAHAQAPSKQIMGDK